MEDSDSTKEGLDKSDGLVVALAVALLIFSGILLFAIIKRVINKNNISEAAKDVTLEVAPGEGGGAAADTVDVSGITDVSSEPSAPRSFDDDGDGLPGNGEMTTVEII